MFTLSPHLHERCMLLYSMDIGIGHGTCSDQWNMRGETMGQVWTQMLRRRICFCSLRLYFCLSPWEHAAGPRRMRDIDHPRQVQMSGTNQNWPADCCLTSWHLGTICHTAIITWHTLQSLFSVLGWRRYSYPTVAPEFQTSVPRIPLPNH